MSKITSVVAVLGGDTPWWKLQSPRRKRAGGDGFGSA